MAGFADTSATLFRDTWRQPDAASLVAALRDGTARMAAMLDAQTESAMPAILAGLEAAAAKWRIPPNAPGLDRGQLAVPIACLIATGTKR